MNCLYFYCLFFWLFYYTSAQIYQCPNYSPVNPSWSTKKSINQQYDANNLKCNFLMINPKKIINPYRNEMQNYVDSRPFSSVCIKCSMCLVVAKQMDKVFTENYEEINDKKQSEIINEVKNQIDFLCSLGFEKYDLRKFKQFLIITDDFSCSSHVRTKMDGLWPDKLREMCKVYLNNMDVQVLLNDYNKKSANISNYLCQNSGVFRDCASLPLSENTDKYVNYCSNDL